MVQEQAQSNADRIAAFLRRRFGFTDAQIAGIEGNLEVESGFDPTRPNPGEGAIGIAQWEGGRRAALDTYAARHHLQETDLDAQLGYLAKELSGPYKSVLALIRGSNDPGEVAAIWDVGPGGPNSGTGFENSSGEATQTRINDARAIYDRLAAGKSLGGVAIDGGDGTSTNTGGAGSGGAAGFTTGFPGGALDPLNWPSEILGAASSGILKVVLPFATKALFVVGGLALVVVGIDRAAQPVREKAAQVAAPIAAAAA